LNIFIYGSKSFKKDIHSVLDHANIKFKLDADSVIQNIEDLDTLKSTIESSPHDIYLIEEEKIIKKNSLNSKVKFLTPKDGIEEDFLLEHSIPDITIDSLDDLPKYIIKKHDEYLEEMESYEVQNEIIDIVDDAYANDKEEIIDDELSMLLAKDDDEDSTKIDDFSNDGFDEHKFDENIDNTNTNLDLVSEVSNEDENLVEEIIPEIKIEDENEPIDIVDFEKELENIDDLMDTEAPALKLEEADSLNLDELEDIIEETSDNTSDKNETSENLIEETSNNTIDTDDLDLLDDLIETSENEDLSENLEDDNLDDLLSDLDNNLEDSIKEDNEELNLDEIQNQLEENDDKIEDINDFEDLLETSEPTQETGEDLMSDNFSELDNISEADLLEALNDASIPSSKASTEKRPQNSISTTPSTSGQTMEVSGKDFEELAKVFSQLLNNKTIEITIKIKD